MVPVLVLPPATDAGEIMSETTDVARIVILTPILLVPRLAAICAEVLIETGLVLIVNKAEVEPGPIETLLWTVALLLFELRVMDAP